MGFQLDEVISDPGWSAKTLQRPGIGQILRAIEAGDVETVIILKLDRLTRSLADLQHLLTLIDKHGARLISVSETLDTSSAAGRLVVNVLGMFAQHEREVIGERTSLGLATKRRNGRPYGRVPFGFSRVGDSLVPDPVQQRNLRHVRRMFDDGISYGRIAEWLNQKGVKPPQGGKTWHGTSVRKMCLSKAFAEGVGAEAVA
jgi:DNA invertase Pin-like site-specific DNA recombinase